MKINWRVRFKNPIFLIQILCGVLGPIFAYFGLVWEDMTTWGCLLKVLLKAIQNPVVVVAVLISIFNAVTDPTTKGMGDSVQAREYKSPN
ncbi:MAG: phage holin [Aminipila sp.]